MSYYNENVLINVHRMLNVLINFHTNCIHRLKKLRSLTFTKNDIEKMWKNVFFSKIIKNVLNIRYIYVKLTKEFVEFHMKCFKEGL